MMLTSSMFQFDEWR